MAPSPADTVEWRGPSSLRPLGVTSTCGDNIRSAPRGQCRCVSRIQTIVAKHVARIPRIGWRAGGRSVAGWPRGRGGSRTGWGRRLEMRPPVSHVVWGPPRVWRAVCDPRLPRMARRARRRTPSALAHTRTRRQSRCASSFFHGLIHESFYAARAPRQVWITTTGITGEMIVSWVTMGAAASASTVRFGLAVGTLNDTAVGSSVVFDDAGAVQAMR